MLSLIFAGEAIFLPAFGLNRYFKTPFMAAFAIDEKDIGDMFVVYGIVAMISYLIGGPLADRFAPRWLMAGSLLATAAGAVYLATIPSLFQLKVLFGFWGASTILAFWAALIRATHDWARHDEQGRAFGLLDGGRGLTAALIASACAFGFGIMLGNADNPTLEMQTTAVKRIAWTYAACNAVAAICVWLFVRESGQVIDPAETPHELPQTTVWQRLGRVLASPAIWLQAVVIIAAYSAFKMMDNYGIYAEDAFGYTSSESAKLVANISYIRAFAAIGAGFVADRLLGVRRTIQLCFVILTISYITFLTMPTTTTMWPLMAANMALSCLGFFALRGIYFAMVEETGTPHHLTGTAVGVISFVGFLPEIYMGVFTGWLITDAREAGDVLVGYRQIFWCLLVMSLVGIVATVVLRRYVGKTDNDSNRAP